MNDFVIYTGHYEKVHCDVLAEDGNVYTQIWPNAGAFRQGELTLCSDEDRKPIKVKDSPIHPAILRMDPKMSLEEYTEATKDEEAIEAYKLVRGPVAEDEYQQFLAEQREENRRHSLPMSIYKPHRRHLYSPLTTKERKAKRKAKKAERQRKKKGRR